MTPELIVTLVVGILGTIGGVIGGGIGVAWLNRDKTRADAAGMLTDGTVKLLNEIQEERAADRLRIEQQRQRIDNFDATLDEIRRIYDERIERLETEIEIQANAIENLNGENLKLQAVIRVYVQQLWERGIEPIIDPDRISSVTVKELNRILAGYKSINQRRASRPKTESDS